MGGKLAKVLKELDLSKTFSPIVTDLIFTEYDKEHRGYLTRIEIRLLLIEWCTVHHKQDIDAVFDAFMRRFDVSMDGKITKHILVSGGVSFLAKKDREWNETLRSQVMCALRAEDKNVAKLLLEGAICINLSHLPSFESHSSLGITASTTDATQDYCNLDNKMAQTLKEALEHNVSVTSVSLHVTDDMSTDGLQAITKIFTQANHISKLVLSFQETKLERFHGWSVFSKMLEHPNCRLTDVTWSGDLPQELFESLVESLSKSFSIHSFAFKNCGRLTSESIIIMMRMLEVAKLTHLEYDQVLIGNDNVSLLADALKKNTTLTHLSLKTAGIRVNGSSYLAKIIENTVNLEFLDLVGNVLGEQGLTCIGHALSRNHKLRRLNLGWNLSSLSEGRGIQALRGAIELQVLERNSLLNPFKLEAKELSSSLLSPTSSSMSPSYTHMQTTSIVFVDLNDATKITTVGGTKVYPSLLSLLLDCLRTTPDFSAIDILLKKKLLTKQILINRRMSPQEVDVRKKSLMSRIIDGINRSSSSETEHSTDSSGHELELSVFKIILDRFPEIFDTNIEDHSGTPYAASCGPVLKHILDARTLNHRADNAAAHAIDARIHAATATAFAAFLGASLYSSQADNSVAKSGWSVSVVGKAAFLARVEAEKQKVDRKAFGASAILFY